MENLTKHQIVLLTLLVSFITSIATGIVTVALMNQAPVGITQTINRVVEHTIEKVIATSTSSTNQSVVRETVVVNTEDEIVNAINKNANSVVRIYRNTTDPSANSNAMIFVGLGTAVTSDGIIATDNSLIADGGNYFLMSEDGSLHDLVVLRSQSSESIALLKLKSADKAVPVSPVALAASDLKLGQSVVYVGGETKNTVATGIVASLGTKDVGIASSTASTTPQQSVVTSVQTTITGANLISGGLLLNLSGELVGIKGTFLASARTDLFVPVRAITDTIAAYVASQKKS